MILRTLLLLATLLLAGPAAAQGINTQLPRPLAVEELVAFAEPLEPSSAQLRAVLDAHADYAGRFEALWDTHLRRARDRYHELRFDLARDPDGIEVTAVDQYVRERGRVVAQTVALDQMLLRRLREILAPAQVRQMQRRATFDARRRGMDLDHLPAAGTARIDLLATIAAVEPTDEEWRRLWPHLQRQRHDHRRLFDEWDDAMFAVFSYARWGLSDDGLVTDRIEHLMDRGTSVERTMRRNLRNALLAICATLGHDRAWALRRGIAAEYRPGALRRFLEVDRRPRDVLLAAARLESLTESQREALAGLAERFYAGDAELFDGTLFLLDSFLDGEGSRGQLAHDTALEAEAGAMHERRVDGQAALAREVLQLLDGEQRGAVERRASTVDDPAAGGGTSRHPSLVALTEPPAGRAAAGGPVRERSKGLAALLPPRIGPSTIDLYAAILGLDEAGRTRLDALYDAYVQSFRTVREGVVQDAIDAARSSPAAGATGEEVSAQAFDAALEAIRRVDAAFFHELDTAFGAPSRVRRLRMLRAQEIYGREGRRWRGVGERRDAEIVFTPLLLDARLGPADIDALDDLLSPHEEQRLALLDARQRRWREIIARQRDLDGANGRAAEDGNSARRAERRAEFLARAAEALDALDEQLAALNEQTLAGLAARLDEPSSRALRDAWRRRVLPEVFDDPLCLEAAFRAAGGLENLDENDRIALADQAAAYRDDYERLSLEMAELLPAPSSLDVTAVDRATWRRATADLDEYLAARWRRDDLSVRALVELHLTLPPASLASLAARAPLPTRIVAPRPWPHAEIIDRRRDPRGGWPATPPPR